MNLICLPGQRLCLSDENTDALDKEPRRLHLLKILAGTVSALGKDHVEICKSFRPCDFILARALLQTELSCYQLSTAENELGFVVAVTNEIDPYGVSVVPVSWSEMRCPETLVRELRNSDKIIPGSALKEKVA